MYIVLSMIITSSEMQARIEVDEDWTFTMSSRALQESHNGNTSYIQMPEGMIDKRDKPDV